MKRCPNCRRPFAHELLKFCRFDGSRLVSVSPQEATTMLLPPEQLPDDSVQTETGTESAAGRNSSSRHMTAH